MEPVDAYINDPLLDEEVNEALAKRDPKIIWKMLTTLARMDTEDYQINRAAIKKADLLSVTMLDKEVQRRRSELNKADVTPEGQAKIPPNVIGNRIIDEGNLIYVNRNVYRYDGIKWVMADKEYIRQLALAADGEANTTKDRRSEIVDYVTNKIYRDKMNWRQIEMYEVPVKNGVVDIRTMEVFEHRKQDYIQTCVPWEFNLGAQCPTLMRCLDDYFGKDDDGEMKASAIQEFIGYCLMPHARYKKALLCVGESNCGKSIIPFLIRLILGQENIAAVGVQDMDDARKRAPLLGKLVNMLTELPSDAMIADGGFKTLVSTEEPILFDPKNLTPVVDIPICKHVIVTNTLPKINDKSKGTFNRLLLIKFNYVIPERDQDTTIWDKLRQETQGILNWAMEGAKRLYENNGQFTDPGTEDVRKYRQDQNPMQGFIDDVCEVDEDYKLGGESGYRVKSTVFVERFRSYNGQRWTPQQVFSQLRQLGYDVTKNQHSFPDGKFRCILGLRIN